MPLVFQACRLKLEKLDEVKLIFCHLLSKFLYFWNRPSIVCSDAICMPFACLGKCHVSFASIDGKKPERMLRLERRIAKQTLSIDSSLIRCLVYYSWDCASEIHISYPFVLWNHWITTDFMSFLKWCHLFVSGNVNENTAFYIDILSIISWHCYFNNGIVDEFQL